MSTYDKYHTGVLVVFDLEPVSLSSLTDTDVWSGSKSDTATGNVSHQVVTVWLVPWCHYWVLLPLSTLQWGWVTLWRNIWLNVMFATNISALLDRPEFFYNTTTEIFSIKKHYCRSLSMNKSTVELLFWTTILVDLGVVYVLRLYLVGKRWKDFL